MGTEMNLIGLLTERQLEIRQTCQKMWNCHYDVYIADSEWAALRAASAEALTISEMAKRLGISRQAVHKLVKSMELKELLKVYETPEYKNRKYIVITEKGKDYDIVYQKVKEELLEKIERTMGSDNTCQLKKLLSIDWGIGA